MPREDRHVRDRVGVRDELFVGLANDAPDTVAFRDEKERLLPSDIIWHVIYETESNTNILTVECPVWIACKLIRQFRVRL